MSAIVSIAQNDQIERAVEEALSHLDLARLINGRTVAVKPNDTWADRADITGVTQGDTLRATLRYLKRFSPGRLIVTVGAGAAETEDVFNYSGMMRALRDEEIVFVDHNRPPFVSVELEYGPQPEIMVHEGVLQIETLVSLAQLKVHETATVTLSMKNVAMSFPAADYYGHPRSTERKLHDFFLDMHGFIVGMVQRFPIHLAIVVGHPAMVGLGPLGGKVAETGLVIAGTDPVATDTVGAQLLGFGAQAVRHLWEAGQLGIGENDLEHIEIKGLALDEAFRLFTKRVYGQELTLDHA